jgi:cell division protein FtsN
MNRNSILSPARARPPRYQLGGTLFGVMVGFILGLIVAAAIAFVLTRLPNPFDARSPKSEVVSPNLSSSDRDGARSPDRPRFDLSKILPGTEDRRSSKPEDAGSVPATAADQAAAMVPASASPAGTASQYFLQAGAFQNAADAEDQRAKLALMGIEATMQSVEIPDKGTVNRIRLGPYNSVDEMNQVKADLLKRGVSTAVIKSP